MLAAVVALAVSAAPVRLAVLPFDNDTKDPELELLRTGLADLVMSDLAAVPELTVVERLRVDEVRHELDLQQTKYIDPGTRSKLGKALGATHALFGSLIAVKPKFVLAVRVVEFSKRDVVATVKVDGSPDDVFSMEESLVKQLCALFKLHAETKEWHASLPAVMSWASATALANQGQLAEAQSKSSEAVRLAPDFTLAKEQYAELIKRLRESQKKRAGAIDERVKTLTEHLTAQLGKPPLDRALGARIGLANLALLELQRAVGGKKDKATWVPPERRAEVEALEQRFVTHASALIDELAAAQGKAASPSLSEADEALSKQAFDLDVSTWDFVTPTSVAIDLGRFLGSGWTPYRSDVDEFAVRPSAAQRSPKGLEAARKWFDVAQQRLAKEPADSKEKLAAALANERAEMLVMLGRREEGVAFWQGFLDAYPTAEDFQVYSRKIEAVMLLDDAAERDEKRLASCDAGLAEGLEQLCNRTWRAKGVAGLMALSQRLEACGKKSPALLRAAFTGPAAELKRVADCEAYETLKKKAAAAGTSLDACQ
ncbi:MAG: CsgG/HfaB family protein [Myxococcaceae bacterium]